MVTALRLARARGLPLALATTCVLAACSGNSTDAIQVVGSGGDTVGVWTGTLIPDDPAQMPLAGWLTIAADGSFQLDTDMALFTGTVQTRGNTLSATTTGHPYGNEFPGGGSFNFEGSISRSELSGNWSGGGRGGSMRFRHEEAVSNQPASLSALASTYDGELWVGNTMLPASIVIGADGTFTAATGAGCAANGTVAIADAARNRYQWTAILSGCGAEGTASGSGFMVGDYSVYLSGRLPDAAVWMGGVDGDAPGN